MAKEGESCIGVAPARFPSPPSEATLLQSAFCPWGAQGGGPAAAVPRFCRPFACSGLECHLPLPRGPQHAPTVLTGWFTVTGLDGARVSPRSSLSTMSSSSSETYVQGACLCPHPHSTRFTPVLSLLAQPFRNPISTRSVLCRGRARQP